MAFLGESPRPAVGRRGGSTLHGGAWETNGRGERRVVVVGHRGGRGKVCEKRHGNEKTVAESSRPSVGRHGGSTQNFQKRLGGQQD